MNTWLIVVALAVSLLGLSALLFLKPSVSPSSISLSGEITSVNVKEKVAFVTFVPRDFTVVTFGTPPKEGKQVLSGKLAQYKGKLEFILDD